MKTDNISKFNNILANADYKSTSGRLSQVLGK